MKKIKVLSFIIILPLILMFALIIYSKSNVKTIEKTVSVNHYYFTNHNSGTGVKGPFDLDYLKKFNPNAKEDLIGKDLEFVKNLYGEPSYELVEALEDNKEVKKMYIYCNISSEGEEADSSAIYILFKNHIVENYKIDEFSGIYDPEGVKNKLNTFD